jgi:hypothetical protein
MSVDDHLHARVGTREETLTFRFPDRGATTAGGHLNAIDLATRTVLWSPCGHVTPVDGELCVDSYQALVKLQ